MAERRPLVIISGESQELPLADNIPSASDILQRTFTSTVAPGEAVYVDGSGTVDQAQANASGTSIVLGCAAAAVTGGNPGQVITNGIVTLTTGQWDTVAGTTGGFTPGAKVYLDPSTAGHITETAPTTGGQYVVEVGQALSTTELQLRARRRILLSA